MNAHFSHTITHVQSISHEGKVVVIATHKTGELSYTVRQSGFEDSVIKASGAVKDSALEGFEQWKTLALGESIADASVSQFEQQNLSDAQGNKLVESVYASDAELSVNAPVKLVSVTGHLYVFRVAPSGYLLMNRFILDGMNNTLIPKLEVRYRRSQQKLVPESSGTTNQDSLDFRDINDQPFYEPALSLNFLGKFDTQKPWFSVEHLNTNEHEKFRWNFFTYTDAQGKHPSLKLFSAAASPEGLITLNDQVKIQQDPEAGDKKILTRIAGIVERRIELDGEVVNAFDSCLYNNQVERQTKAGPQLMKEGTRVMLSVPTKVAELDKPSVAALSFAVNNQGLLAQIDRIVDQTELLRGDVKEVLLPLTTLDDIKLIADETPMPMGTIQKIGQGDENLVQITAEESIEDMEVGKKVKITGTQSYNGCYVAKNITPTGFEIEAVFTEESTNSEASQGDEKQTDKGYWEVLDDSDDGLVFENMIASYEKTESGSLKISCPAHNLSEGDEIKIAGSVNQDGTYPIRDINDDNSFLIDDVFPVGEVVNLSKVKRRGLYFDGQGDYLATKPASLSGHKVNHNLERSVSCWVYLDQITEQNQVVMQSCSDKKLEESFSLYVDKQGQMNFQVRFADGYKAKIEDSQVMPLDTWVHYTATLQYQGETSELVSAEKAGATQLLLARSGNVVAEKAIAAAKPVHLPRKNLALAGERLAIDKLHYDQVAQIDEITVEAWINTDQDGYGIIASFDRSEYWRLALTGNKDNRIVQWCTAAKDAKDANVIDDMNGQIHIKNNQWTHVSATFNASTGEKAIYVNGELDSVKTAHDKKALGTGAKRFGFIGVGSEADKVNGSYNANTEYQGLIADVRIWNKCHDVDTINQHRFSLLSGLEQNLAAAWLLDETKSKKIADITRTKAHLKPSAELTWKTASHRIPGLASNTTVEQYAQTHTIGAALNRKNEAVNEFRGKLSDLQVWTIAIEKSALKANMYNQLSGSEFGLVGYWKLGGIAHDINDITKRISPDFSSNALDAQVFGQTYVSACDLSRANSLGKACKYTNDELVAVSQGATYQESFEFRAALPDGDFLTLEEINNADDMGHPLFGFSFWGKSARTSDEVIKISPNVVAVEEFKAIDKDSNDTWFQAKCTFTVPEGINMIRCFEIDHVRGIWGSELQAPEDEWTHLNIRKHKIELISDSITCEQYTDEVELEVLADNASELESAIKEIPTTELDIAEKRQALTHVIEEISLYENVQRFEREKDSLTSSTKTLSSDVAALRKEKNGFASNPLNYLMMWKAQEAGKVLDLSNKKENSQVYIYSQHSGDNQVWEFIRQSNGYYKIKNLANGQYLSASTQGKNTYIKKGEHNSQYWSVTKRSGNYYSIHNKQTGKVLDVYGHGKSDKSRVVLWPYNGQNNQMWQLMPYTRDLVKLDHEIAKYKHIPIHMLAIKSKIASMTKDIKRQFPMGEHKPTYKSELSKIERSFDEKSASLKTQTARLTRITLLLSNRSPERLALLKTIRDNLIKDIVSLDQALASLNTRYLTLASSLQNEAQQMDLISQDKQGLKTYGNLLGFASPQSHVSAIASAEGNVQLSYFDNQGRMRTTEYDACADSTNSSYEQWLPKTIQSCADFSSNGCAVFSKEGFALPESGFTVETWFYYPPVFKADGTPYWLNKLTSSESGNDAIIAILENRRLGTVVNGFFHDSGWDLENNLSHGWHHVAAVAQNGATEFYIDGEAVGISADKQRETARQAMAFDGKNDFLQVGSHNPNYSQGFTIQTWAKFDKFNKWSRIVDFGLGENKSNILFANQGTTKNLSIDIRHGNSPAKSLIAKDVLVANQWQHIAATIDASGTASIYVNGKEVAYGDVQLPDTVNRTHNYIGRSNWKHDKYFDGQLHDLSIWNRALTANEVREYMFESPLGDESGLVNYWSMAAKEKNGVIQAHNGVENSALHAQMKNGVQSSVLDKQSLEAIKGFGNSVKKDAPFGRVSELRFWDVALNSEEIKVNSRIRLNGNEPDLVHYYPLNDAKGTQARDLAVETLNASYQSVKEVACTAPIGNPGTKVFEFDGENDTLELSGINLKNRSFSIEYWVKRKDVDRADWLVYQGNSKANTSLHLGFRNKTTYSFAFYSNDMNVDKPMSANQWIHMSHTYDVKTNLQTWYINGEKVNERKAPKDYAGVGNLMIGARPGMHFKGQMADFRVWSKALSANEVASQWNVRLSGTESHLSAYLPLTDNDASNLTASGKQPTVKGTKLVNCNDLPVIQGQSLVTCEYQTMGVAPEDASQKRAMLRRFYGFAQNGHINLLAGKRIEELTLQWIGNAQFEPTLLGFIEGAPPVPSENLTINYDYDGATSIELIQSEDTTYSWSRSKDFNQGLDLNMFLGAGWGAEGGFGVVSKISEGKAGFRGMLNLRDGTSSNSNIRAQSSQMFSDRLELKGAYETEPTYPHLGNRFVPKNVGYALVTSGLADVFITKMKRTGRMIGYEVTPVKDVPMDVNTITFMINPAYSINGSLDGLVGTKAADERFCKQVPQMRAQYGSLYPSGYYDLHQAYDIKSQIDRWDKERESYFINYDATQTTEAALNNQTADESEYDSYGGVEVDDSEAAEGEEAKSEEDIRNETKDSYDSMKKSGKKDAEKRKEQINAQMGDSDKRVEANAAFDSWQQRMENLQIRAAKRNIVNTYVWDADGGMRSEEQSFANTVEHTIGGNFSLSGSAGLDTDVMVTGFKFELQALYAAEMTQTMSKTLSTTNGLDLNVRLDGVERKGVTDAKDYPVLPGEKVDRYRFMSYYLEGNTDHFHDFFDQVVDPEWLMSNDEEARALRQVGQGRANKCWRVMHRVTYVERPALMGFGQDLRSENGAEEAATEVFNYFDALEQANDALRADLSELKSQIGTLSTQIDQLDKEEG